MTRVHPYKTIEDYDFDPNTSVTMLLTGFIVAIAVTAVLFAVLYFVRMA
jgi:hypothetical protein